MGEHLLPVVRDYFLAFKEHDALGEDYAIFRAFLGGYLLGSGFCTTMEEATEVVINFEPVLKAWDENPPFNE